MEFESSGLSKEEIRKRRRKKERTQALMILGGVVLAVCLVLGIGIAVLVNIMTGSGEAEETASVDAVATETVADTAEAETFGDSASKEQSGENVDADSLTEESTEVTPSESESEDASETEESEGAPEDSQVAEGDEEADMTAEEYLEQEIANKIAGMTIEQKVAGLFIVTPGQLMGTGSVMTSVGSEFGQKVLDYPVGGFVLDNSNIGTADDLKALVSCIRMYAGDDIFVGITDEGGEAGPFVATGVTENVISSKKEIGESLGVSGAYSAGISLGSELKQFGFDVNFAPSVDVSLKTGSVAERKGFGTDMATTAELGKNMVSGMVDQDIHVAVGYFPSYGDVTHAGESGQVISQRKLEDLQGEYEPYLAAIDAGAEFLMVSHVSLPKLRGDNRPASLSPEIITDIIRTEWGYDGIVITDYMNKSCIFQKYTYAEAAVGAIEAGADMILSPKNFEKSYNGILDAVKKGEITEERINESLTRIYRVRFSRS